MRTFFAKTAFMLLFLVVFNVLFFLVIGTENPTSVWISYGFIHFSYFTILFLPVISSKGEASYYLSSTLYVQSIAYFLLELIAGIVFIILQLETYIWPVVIQTVLWFLFAIVFLGNVWANHSTAQSLEKRKADISAYRNMHMNLKRLAVMTKNPSFSRDIIHLCDNLETGASRQTSESQGVDADIEASIANLRKAILEGEDARTTQLISQLGALIEERKAILKYSH
jgi:hypothetical protein